MIVIGFNWPPEHDHAVAVIQNGELVFAAEEERFTRHKHSVYEPPLRALRQAFTFLKKRGIKPKDVDAYAINSDYKLTDNGSLKYQYLKYSQTLSFLHATGVVTAGYQDLFTLVKEFIRADLLELARKLIRKAILDIGEEVQSEIRIYPVRHHLAHAHPHIISRATIRLLF